MSKEKVIKYFEENGLLGRIKEFDESSATVELAAKRLNVEQGRIAKTLAFSINDEPILIVVSGDKKIDNTKYRNEFNTKATMINRDILEEKVGHKVGGVCPFEVNNGVKVYLDISLKAYDTLYPACGASNNAIELSIEELEKHSKYIKWIDVCK